MTESPSRQPPTVGQALANLSMYDLGAYGAMLLVIVGAIAPWATSPLVSVSGMSGLDGKVMAGLAIIGLFTIWRGGPAGAWLLILALVIGAIAVYDIVHGDHIAQHSTFEGVQLVHVGWGLYLAAAAALVSIAVNVRAWRL